MGFKWCNSIGVITPLKGQNRNAHHAQTEGTQNGSGTDSGICPGDRLDFPAEGGDLAGL